MEIAKASMQDLNEIAALEAACFPPAEAASRAAFFRRLTVYPNHFWLLRDEKTLAACVNGMVTDAPHLTDDLYENADMHNEGGPWQMIFGVATLPEYRGRGCAARLLQAAIADAAAQGRQGLVLTCKTRLISYYAKFGFLDEGVSASEHGGVLWHEMRLRFPEQREAGSRNASPSGPRQEGRA